MYTISIGYGCQHVRQNSWVLTQLRSTKRRFSELRGVHRDRSSCPVSFASLLERHGSPNRDPKSSTRGSIDKGSIYCPRVQQKLSTLLPHFGCEDQSLATLMRLCMEGRALWRGIIDINRPRGACHIPPVGLVLARLTEEVCSRCKVFKNYHLS